MLITLSTELKTFQGLEIAEYPATLARRNSTAANLRDRFFSRMFPLGETRKVLIPKKVFLIK